MLEEERRELRDRLEREWGIKVPLDDSFIPTLHYVDTNMKAVLAMVEEAKLSKDEAKEIFAEMKKFFSESLKRFQDMYVQGGSKITAIQEAFRDEVLTIRPEISALKKSVSNIPEEVKINYVRTFETKTMSFLWTYFVVSLAVILLSVWFGFKGHYMGQEKIQTSVDQQLKPLRNELQWYRGFYQEMSTNGAPNSTQRYVQDHPFPE